MRLIAGIILSVLANTFGLLLAANYIAGFTLAGDFKEVILVGFVLTLLNITLKPILRMFLAPIIILTLGLGLIVVNGIVLYILDILSKNLTIEGIASLIWGAVVIGILNFIVHLAKK